jgi:hypothetical protein
LSEGSGAARYDLIYVGMLTLVLGLLAFFVIYDPLNVFPWGV